jgi:hypothetical protein
MFQQPQRLRLIFFFAVLHHVDQYADQHHRCGAKTPVPKQITDCEQHKVSPSLELYPNDDAKPEKKLAGDNRRLFSFAKRKNARVRSARFFVRFSVVESARRTARSRGA